MKLRVFDQPHSTEKEVFLKLVPGTGNVELQALNSMGDRLATLARIYPSGIYRLRFVDPAIGLTLENDGRLKDISNE